MDLDQERRQKIRRQMDRDLGLARDDLFLVLETYRNSIEHSTTVLGRLETITAGIERIRAELVKTCDTQSAIAADIGKLPGAVRDLIDQVTHTIDDHRKEQAREHGAQTLRIYGAFGILGTLAIALLGLIVKIWPALSTVPGTMVSIPGP